ncbi:MAG: T9SS type A sorting domain-containing protein [bacterium]
MTPTLKIVIGALCYSAMSALSWAQQCPTDPEELWRHEFRSIQNGAWEDTTTWEEYHPETAQWCPAERVPSYEYGAITVQRYTNGTVDTVKITSTVLADQLTVDGRLEVRGLDGHLTITKGDIDPYDLVVSGELAIHDGRLDLLAGARAHINAGGRFIILKGASGYLVARISTAAIHNLGDILIDGRFTYEDGSVTGNPFRYGPSTVLFLENVASGVIDSTNVFWPSTNGPRWVYVQGPGGVTFNGARTVEELYTYVPMSGGGNLTINKLLSLQPGGFITGAPTYASGSTLAYATGGTYARGDEWSATSGAGYPSNVSIDNNTILNYPNGSTAARGLSGDLRIHTGSSLYMDFGNIGVNNALTVGGNVHFEGALSLGDAPGGDLYLGGNWTTNSNRGTFNPNARTVAFSGSTEQLIGGINSTHTFDHLTIDNPAGVRLDNPTTVNQSLTFSAGNLVLPYILTLLGTVHGASRESHAVTLHSGYIARPISPGESFEFPVGGSAATYNPVTIVRAGGGGPQTFYVQVKDSFTVQPKQPDGVLRRQWGISHPGIAASNLTLTFQWEPGDPAGSQFNPEAGVAMGWHNGLEWIETAATYSAGPPHCATASFIGTGGLFGIGNLGALTSVAEHKAAPQEFALSQNYPNPFNPTTTIGYALPVDADVSLAVYNIQGQKVVQLVEGRMSVGYHEASFDASQLASGVYVYRLQAGELVKSMKLVLFK